LGLKERSDVTMGKSEAEKQRLRKKSRNCESLIRELERKNDRSSQEELRRQKQEKSNLEYELNHG
jgi:hypothetical protein